MDEIQNLILIATDNRSDGWSKAEAVRKLVFLQATIDAVLQNR